jgi:hypothetical protein
MPLIAKEEYYKSWILRTGVDTATANGKGKEAIFYGGALKELSEEKIKKFKNILIENKFNYIIDSYPVKDRLQNKIYLQFSYKIIDGYLNELDELELILNN